MANIPVERKKGGAWWLWLLALLVLALVIWLLWSWFAGPDEEEAVVPPVAGIEEPAEPVVGSEVEPLDQAVLFAAADPALYVGRQVRLTGLQVQEVLGDVTFTVSTPNDPARALVVLNQKPSPEVPSIEGQVDLNAGQTVNITGTIESMPANPGEQWEISDDRAQELGQQTVYVRAEQVDITESQLDQPVEVEEVQ